MKIITRIFLAIGTMATISSINYVVCCINKDCGLIFLSGLIALLAGLLGLMGED